MHPWPRSGWFKASCRPEADLVARRTLLRHRAQLLQQRAPHVLHRPQALWPMTMPLSHALSEVPGAPGPRIIRAIGAGERAPCPRAALRNSRGQKEGDARAHALPGTWRAAPLFVLTHALALCDCSPTPRSAGDPPIARGFSVMQPRGAPAPAASWPTRPTPPPRKPHAHSMNAPANPTRAPLLRMTGVDLVAVHGISPAIAQTILAAIGTARSQWPDETPCCSWRGLAPNNAISGGQGLQRRTMQTRHRAAHAFRMAAHSVLRADCALGALSRRVQGRRGPAQALVATAHNLARTVSHRLQERLPSHDIGAAEYNKRFRARERTY